METKHMMQMEIIIFKIYKNERKTFRITAKL